MKWWTFAGRFISRFRERFESAKEHFEIVADAARKDLFVKACWLIWIAALTAAFLYSLKIPLRYLFVVIALAVVLFGLPTLRAPRRAPKWLAMFVSSAVPVARAIIVLVLTVKLAILVWNSQRPPVPLAVIDVDTSYENWRSTGCERSDGTRLKPARDGHVIPLPSGKPGRLRWRFEGEDVPKDAHIVIRIVYRAAVANDPRMIADGDVTEYPTGDETWFVQTIDGGENPFRLVAYAVD